MLCAVFFFFNDTATTEIYTLSLHDALPIWFSPPLMLRFAVDDLKAYYLEAGAAGSAKPSSRQLGGARRDRKSTRLNSSHVRISYAVFCLQKKDNVQDIRQASVVRLANPRAA